MSCPGDGMMLGMALLVLLQVAQNCLLGVGFPPTGQLASVRQWIPHSQWGTENPNGNPLLCLDHDLPSLLGRDEGKLWTVYSYWLPLKINVKLSVAANTIPLLAMYFVKTGSREWFEDYSEWWFCYLFVYFNIPPSFSMGTKVAYTILCFISTTNLWGRLDWEHMAGPRSLRKILWQNGDWSMDFPYPGPTL